MYSIVNVYQKRHPVFGHVGFGLQELAHIPLVIYFLVRPLCSNQLLAYLIPKFEFSLPVTHRG